MPKLISKPARAEEVLATVAGGPSGVAREGR
jgi:hypothetical protein